MPTITSHHTKDFFNFKNHFFNEDGSFKVMNKYEDIQLVQSFPLNGVTISISQESEASLDGEVIDYTVYTLEDNAENKYKFVSAYTQESYHLAVELYYNFKQFIKGLLLDKSNNANDFL